eukprot:1161988-Pelagomonas_calceolata.AAC.5
MERAGSNEWCTVCRQQSSVQAATKACAYRNEVVDAPKKAQAAMKMCRHAAGRKLFFFPGRHM